ncbi:MAG: hypothetical protein ACRDT6_09470 [Micromonosporaceae bacterium]
MMDGITPPAASVIITPTEMYREMQDIGRKVDHLASVVDPAMNTLREDITDLRRDLAVGTSQCLSDTKAMDVRVRSLEHWRWFVLGVAAIAGPAAGVVMARLLGVS